MSSEWKFNAFVETVINGMQCTKYGQIVGVSGNRVNQAVHNVMRILRFHASKRMKLNASAINESLDIASFRKNASFWANVLADYSKHVETISSNDMDERFETYSVDVKVTLWICGVLGHFHYSDADAKRCLMNRGVLPKQNHLTEEAAEKSIACLNLSSRPYNCLKAEGVETVGQLCNLISDENMPLLKTPNFGHKSYREVLNALALIGISPKINYLE